MFHRDRFRTSYHNHFRKKICSFFAKGLMEEQNRPRRGSRPCFLSETCLGNYMLSFFVKIRIQFLSFGVAICYSKYSSDFPKVNLPCLTQFSHVTEMTCRISHSLNNLHPSHKPDIPQKFNELSTCLIDNFCEQAMQIKCYGSFLNSTSYLLCTLFISTLQLLKSVD